MSSNITCSCNPNYLSNQIPMFSSLWGRHFECMLYCIHTLFYGLGHILWASILGVADFFHRLCLVLHVLYTILATILGTIFCKSIMASCIYCGLRFVSEFLLCSKWSSISYFLHRKNLDWRGCVSVSFVFRLTSVCSRTSSRPSPAALFCFVPQFRFFFRLTSVCSSL